MGVMRILNMSGDEKVTWTANDELSIARARRRFDELTGKGWTGYLVKDGRPSSIVKSFDEVDHASEILMRPRYAGG